MSEYTTPERCEKCDEPVSLCQCNVIIWPGTTLRAIPVDRIARAADKAKLKLCIIVGVDEHGDFYFASSDGDLGMVLWQLERAKQDLFKLGG